MVITFRSEKKEEINPSVITIYSIMLLKCQECNTFSVTRKICLYFASWLAIKLGSSHKKCVNFIEVSFMCMILSQHEFTILRFNLNAEALKN